MTMLYDYYGARRKTGLTSFHIIHINMQDSGVLKIHCIYFEALLCSNLVLQGCKQVVVEMK